MPAYGWHQGPKDPTKTLRAYHENSVMKPQTYTHHTLLHRFYPNFQLHFSGTDNSKMCNIPSIPGRKGLEPEMAAKIFIYCKTLQIIVFSCKLQLLSNQCQECAYYVAFSLLYSVFLNLSRSHRSLAEIKLIHNSFKSRKRHFPKKSLSLAEINFSHHVFILQNFSFKIIRLFL